METTIRGVSSRSLRILEDVLWEWVALQERSARLWKWDDVPWWYNERASLSGLAGAVWRAGGVALEEYSTEKTRTLANRKTRWPLGRGDMYLLLSGHAFIAEVKHVWVGLRARDPVKLVEDALHGARLDVRRSRIYAKERRLAAVFVAPYQPITHRESISSTIDAWVNKTAKVSNCARAWVFPQETRYIPWETDKRFYPGAALFVQNAD